MWRMGTSPPSTFRPPRSNKRSTSVPSRSRGCHDGVQSDSGSVRNYASGLTSYPTHRHKHSMTTPTKAGLKYGIILGLLLVANVQILTWLGLGLTSWVFAGHLFLLLVTAYLALKQFRAAKEGVLSIGNALVINAVMVLVATFINQAYMFVYITMIDPMWVDAVAEMRRQTLLDAGLEGAGVDDRVMAFRQAFTPLRMFTRGVIMPSLWDFVFAGIVAVFMRTKAISAAAA